MPRESDTVLAIRALRLLRERSARSGGLRGDEYDRIIRQAMPRSTAYLNWPTELMIILLRANLIQVRRTDQDRLMTAAEFEDVVRGLNLTEFVFSVPPHFEDLCHALGVTTLAELEQRADPESVSVSPQFGTPRGTGMLRRDVIVLIPFGAALSLVYKHAIAPAIEDLGLTVARADDLFARQDVITAIWQAIYTAKMVIADCTEQNAAVFYELGIAHTVGKPTLLLAQRLDDIPYNIRQFRYLLYQPTKEGVARLRQDVRYTVQQIQRGAA